MICHDTKMLVIDYVPDAVHYSVSWLLLQCYNKRGSSYLLELVLLFSSDKLPGVESPDCMEYFFNFLLRKKSIYS